MTTHRTLRIRPRRARKAGFTLLELMVAMLIGSMVVAALYTLGSGSSRHFQEQQRIGVTQRSVRMAMDRLRRDIARAGYLHVPSNLDPNLQTCPAPAAPRDVPAVWFQDGDPVGQAALAAINGPANRVSADRLRLIGNYTTGDDYRTYTFSGAGTTIDLQTNWLAFRRSFVVDIGAGPVVDVDRFNSVFQSGRMLHVQTGSKHAFVRITGASINASGTTAQVMISPALPPGACVAGLGVGGSVSPLSEVEYFIDQPAADSALAPRSPAVTGAATHLIRRELDMGTGMELPGTRRVVLEYAVDFNLDFIVDQQLTPGSPPDLQRIDGALAAPVVQARPWQVRGIIASLAARTPEQDTRFPWPESWNAGRPIGQPLSRYQVFPGQDGAARVRALTTEVMMPNMAR